MIRQLKLYTMSYFYMYLGCTRKYELVFAKHGEEAILLAQSTCPALILLDVEMPGIDGYETCRQLKALDCMAAVPVIFVSGCDLIEDRLKGYGAGGDDYVIKPFSMRDIEARLQALLIPPSEV